jgi:hypothetical protein
VGHGQVESKGRQGETSQRMKSCGELLGGGGVE